MSKMNIGRHRKTYLPGNNSFDLGSLLLLALEDRGNVARGVLDTVQRCVAARRDGALNSSVEKAAVGGC